jgi:hypothetical protein
LRPGGATPHSPPQRIDSRRSVHVREQIIMEQPPHTGAALTRAVDRLADAPLELDAACVPALLALLAAGRFDRVRPIIAGAGSAVEPAVLALVLGRYVAWTGDLHLAASLWQRVRDSLDSAPAGGEDFTRVLTAGALLSIERLASDVGDPRTAARVHGPVRDAMRQLHQRLSGSGTEPAGAPLRHLAAAAGFDEPPGTAPAALGTGTADPAAGNVHGSDVAAATPGCPAADAELMLYIAHGQLGLDADATRHRLRLRPVLPANGTVVIRSIGFGDATISIVVTAAEGMVRIELEQDSGALPVTALLEPAVEAAALHGAAVDGTPASLTPRPWAGRLLVPVQLVLDARRTLVLQLDARGGRSPE